jgi:Nuclease-related domain
MPSKRHEHDRACRCERADGGCAALAVQRLSRTRVQELAEEIWTVSTGTTVPVQPLLDPRGSRPGASAHAAYRRCRHREREQWRDRWWWPWRSVMVAAAAMLAQLEQEGWLVLHDVALPGWSASLDHLVIGPTGAWAIDSWRNSPRPDLTWKAEAVADSLAGTGIPVRRLLCLQAGVRLPGRRSVQGIALVSLRRLPDIVRHGSPVQAIEVQRASARALEVLRPAA